MGKMIEKVALSRNHEIAAKIDLGSDSPDFNNIDVAIRRRNTTCSITTADNDCTLLNDAIVFIQAECNKQVSCEIDISNFTKNQSCLHENGYVNVWYTCKGKCLIWD